MPKTKMWRRGVLLLTTVHMHKTKSELKFCAYSNSSRGVSQICDGQNFSMWPCVSRQILKEFTDKSSLTLLHLNTCSLSKIIDDFKHVFQSTKTDFDVIAISESWITKNKLPPVDVIVPNCSDEFCPTEANACSTLIYVRNHLPCKTSNYLKIYKSLELESTFTEICNSKKTNIIIGYIYKHPNININEINDDYFNELPEKLSKENKTNKINKIKLKIIMIGSGQD